MSLFFILGDFGELGPEFLARAPEEMTRECTEQYLASGELKRPSLAVIEVDLAAGTSRDVSAEFGIERYDDALSLYKRAGEPRSVSYVQRLFEGFRQL